MRQAWQNRAFRSPFEGGSLTRAAMRRRCRGWDQPRSFTAATPELASIADASRRGTALDGRPLTPVTGAPHRPDAATDEGGTRTGLETVSTLSATCKSV
jgi:hypothetical protein